LAPRNQKLSFSHRGVTTTSPELPAGSCDGHQPLGPGTRPEEGWPYRAPRGGHQTPSTQGRITEPVPAPETVPEPLGRSFFQQVARGGSGGPLHPWKHSRPGWTGL